MRASRIILGNHSAISDLGSPGLNLKTSSTLLCTAGRHRERQLHADTCSRPLRPVATWICSTCLDQLAVQ